MSRAKTKVKSKTTKDNAAKILKNARIVKYKPEYRKEIEEICWETAFFGERGTPLVEDKRLIIDFLCRYYFDYEPDKIFVALYKNKVIGYLLGCTDTIKQERVFDKNVMPSISMRFLKGNYKLGLKTFQFLFRGLIWYAVFEGRLHLPLKDYPAHLHMNMTEKFRRYGIGTKLIKAYFEYLLKNNITGLHLITTSHHRLANPFYNKLGFKVYNKKPTKMWSHAIKEEVYFRVYIIRITKDLLNNWGRILKRYTKKASKINI